MPYSNTQEKTILCFDYGTKTIGVAVGQTITNTATPLTELKAVDGIPKWDEISTLILEWKPDLLLIGQPLNMDGSHSEMTERAEKFARRLHGRFGLKAEMADERLSSFSAKGEILENEKSSDFKNHHIDSIAARIILEGWLSEQLQ